MERTLAKGMRVTFPDGTVIWHRQAIDTFIDALRKIGLERNPMITGIVLVTAGLLALAFMGFSGLEGGLAQLFGLN